MDPQISSYKLKLNNFEGPLDLLLHLIEKNDMDIYDIKINEVTDQYMDYLYSMEWDMELFSEFLVMAATLLHIKSKTILPVKKDEENPEEDPRADLVKKLVEYRKYKHISSEMLKREQEWMRALYKQREVINFTREYETIELNVNSLHECMVYINERNKRIYNDNREKMERILRHEKVSLRDKMNEIIVKLKKQTNLVFSEIFHITKSSKIVVVTGFQAILELSKIKKIKIHQSKPFDEIRITKNEENFNEEIGEDSYV